MSALNSGGVCRAVGRGGRRVAAARVLLATASAARQQQQQQTASSATVAAAAASRHTSSLPPVLPTELSSSAPTPPALPKTPVDYHYPFGNPSLLISTLPSRQHASSSGPGPVASPSADVPSKKPPPESTRDAAAAASAPRQHSPATPTEAQSGRIHRPATPRSRPKKTQKRGLPGRPETVGGPAPVAADRQQQPQRGAGRDGATALEAAVVEGDPDDASVTAAVELPPPPPLSDPIHVLGSDPRATYLAHLLAGIPNSPPVRLVLLGRARQNRWKAEGGGVRVLRGGRLLPRHNVEAEPAREAPPPHASGGGRGRYASAPAPAPADLAPIENLVVTVGCAGSIDAIQKLQHRIDQRTTICLIQCGLGVVERLNALCFPDPATRPRFVLGHMTHSLGYNDRSFTVSELKPGKLILTAYQEPTTTTTATKKTTATADGGGGGVAASPADDGRRLVHLLSVAPLLGAGGYAAGDFLRWALPAMLYTAAVEPVATVLDLPVDALWHNGEARALVEALLTEMLAVVRRLPETQASPALAEAVQSGALRRQVLRRRQQPQKHEAAALGGSSGSSDGGYGGYGGSGGSGDDDESPMAAWDDPAAQFAASGPRGGGASLSLSSSASSSSPVPSAPLCTMAQRVRAGRVTDIEFLNGYFVRRGRAVGVACPMNEMAIRLVRAKQLTNRARLRAFVPLVSDGRRGRDARSASAADVGRAGDPFVYPGDAAPEAAQPPPRRVPAWWRMPALSA